MMKKPKIFVKVIDYRLQFLASDILQTLSKFYFHNLSELIELIIVVMIIIHNTLIVSYR